MRYFFIAIALLILPISPAQAGEPTEQLKQRVDQIMILEDGQGQESGQREALVHDPESRFSQVLKAGMEEVLSV